MNEPFLGASFSPSSSISAINCIQGRGHARISAILTQCRRGKAVYLSQRWRSNIGSDMDNTICVCRGRTTLIIADEFTAGIGVMGKGSYSISNCKENGSAKNRYPFSPVKPQLYQRNAPSISKQRPTLSSSSTPRPINLSNRSHALAHHLIPRLLFRRPVLHRRCTIISTSISHRR